MMKPRWKVALMLFTFPIWLLPALIYVGWQEGGREFIQDIPTAWNWAIKGIKP